MKHYWVALLPESHLIYTEILTVVFSEGQDSMHRTEPTIRPGYLFAHSVNCSTFGNISQLEPRQLYTATAVTGIATSYSGFYYVDYNRSMLTVMSECSLPASWLMHRAPGMFHLACLVICHLLLPWRMERKAKLEALRTWSSLPQVSILEPVTPACVRSSIFKISGNLLWHSAFPVF